MPQDPYYTPEAINARQRAREDQRRVASRADTMTLDAENRAREEAARRAGDPYYAHTRQGMFGPVSEPRFMGPGDTVTPPTEPPPMMEPEAGGWTTGDEEFYQEIRGGPVGAGTSEMKPGALRVSAGPLPPSNELPPGWNPQAEARSFLAGRVGKLPSAEYLGIPDYEIAQRGEPGYDPAAAGERSRFLNQFVRQKLADDLAYSQYEQQMAKSRIDPREMLGAEVELTRQRAALAGAEAGARGAEAEMIRARTALLNDPVAMAAKQGRASAGELLAYRERVMEQARTEVDPFLAEQLAMDMVRSKLAPDLISAKQRVMEQMAKKQYDAILADDPQLQQIMARSGIGSGM